MKSQEEHHIQCEFVKIARYYLNGTGRILYANVNESYGGTKADVIRGAKFKREGRLSGVPDIFIAWPRLGFHGLYIEFKKPKAYLSQNQKEVIERLREAGYCVAVCRSASDAYDLLVRYTIESHEDNVLKDHNWK